jgi:hypothetical protein
MDATKEVGAMEIPLGVEVLCGGKTCGRSIALVLNPVTDEVTHVVVREHSGPHEERMVPSNVIERGEKGELVLNATREELAGMEPFQEAHFFRTRVDHHVAGMGYTWPYVTHDREPLYILEIEERIPHGEVAVHRGAKVLASDGPVGKVDEFLVTKEGLHVTHLVLREGHLWGKRDVAIPVSKIERMSEETVYLRLSKKEVEALPAVPVRRKHAGEQDTTAKRSPGKHP